MESEPQSPLKGKITLRIAKAFLLKEKDEGFSHGNGKMDPYCTVVYEDSKYKTRVKQDAGKNPVWNEEFVFDVSSEKDIKISVLDQDFVSKGEMCGIFEGKIQEIIGDNPQHDQYFEQSLALKNID